MPAASASSRRPMRAPRPGRVRAPWRSRPSWPLQVQKVDSIHWRTAPRLPWRARFVFAVGAQEGGARLGHEVLRTRRRRSPCRRSRCVRRRGRARASRRRRRVRRGWRRPVPSRSASRRLRRSGRAGSPKTSVCGCGSSRSRRCRRTRSGAWSRATGRTAPAWSPAAERGRRSWARRTPGRLMQRADLRRQAPQPAVIAGLIDQQREQMPQPPAREREELAVVGHRRATPARPRA